MSFYWTTTEITDKNITIENGGHYEALNRDINPSTVKISHDIIPSSDISELCVSGSPEASLFAKIQSSQKEGKYYIYKTDERPDTELSNISLDFGVLEEYRYNMDKRDSVNLDLFKTVTENQGESLAVHGGDESDSADTTHVWYAERMF